MYSVTLTRSFKDGEGNWHDSSSFGFGDLMTAAKALYDAHSAISAMISRERADAGSPAPR
jgi:hypothetical protein